MPSEKAHVVQKLEDLNEAQRLIRKYFGPTTDVATVLKNRIDLAGMQLQRIEELES